MRLTREKRRICFHCAHIFQAGEAEELICPACGFHMDFARYCMIVDQARDAVDYGYQYRLAMSGSLRKRAF